jgi:hypothetical protein
MQIKDRVFIVTGCDGLQELARKLPGSLYKEISAASSPTQ